MIKDGSDVLFVLSIGIRYVFAAAELGIHHETMELQVVPQVHRTVTSSIIHYHIDVPLPNGTFIRCTCILPVIALCVTCQQLFLSFGSECRLGS